MHRTVLDAEGKQLAAMLGRATLVLIAPNTWRYTERVIHKGLDATATYFFALENNQIAIADHSSRHLVTLPFPVPPGTGATHRCGDDYYTLEVHMCTWERCSYTVTVSGPRKNYTLTTDATRSSSNPWL